MGVRLTEEQGLRLRLSSLHREYQRRAQPVIDRLVEIENSKPPKPVVIDISAVDPSVLESIKRSVEAKLSGD